MLVIVGAMSPFNSANRMTWVRQESTFPSSAFMARLKEPVTPSGDRRALGWCCHCHLLSFWHSSGQRRRIIMSTVTTTHGVQIFYKDWGPKETRPIVFHHGWPLSADDWDTQMLFFVRQGYRVDRHRSPRTWTFKPGVRRTRHGPLRRRCRRRSSSIWICTTPSISAIPAAVAKLPATSRATARGGSLRRC